MKIHHFITIFQVGTLIVACLMSLFILDNEIYEDRTMSQSLINVYLMHSPRHLISNSPLNQLMSELLKERMCLFVR